MSLLDTEIWNGAVFSGSWTAGTGELLEVVEPATSEVLGTVGQAGPDEVHDAAAQAAQAQLAWAGSPFDRRAAVLRAAAALLETNADEATQWLIREAGSVGPKADFEVAGTVSILWNAAGLCARDIGSVLPSSDPGRLSMARRLPVGVVGVIAPWNFPLLLAMRSVAPALALGNAVVLKPPPETAVSGGVLIARLFEEAGLPPGLLHVLPGPGKTGEAVVTAPDVRLICFTGSTETGLRVGELAASLGKRSALELGGKNPVIILDDADPATAAANAAWGTFLHQGQICMSAGRHLVHERIRDAYVEELVIRARRLPVGDPKGGDVALGPLISRRQLERVDKIVTGSVAAGAEMIAGGTHRGLFYDPTVLSGVTPQMPAFTEEIFGPVAAISSFSDEEEALQLANEGCMGLSASIFTSDLDRALALAGRIRAGLVHINDQPVNWEAHAPFGGLDHSGNGTRVGGDADLDGFTERQWITLRGSSPVYPF